MGKAKAFYDQEYSKHVGASIQFLAAFVGFALLTAGTPLGVLMDRNNTVNPKQCNTLWGVRPNCWNAEYSWRIEEETCNYRRVRWEAAEAFSIIGIFATLFVVGAAWYQITGSELKTITLFISAFSIGATTVPWAVVTSFYYNDYCGELTMTKEEKKLGAGYILMVTSFAVQCVGFLGMLFLEPSKEQREAAKQQAKAAAEEDSS